LSRSAIAIGCAGLFVLAGCTGTIASEPDQASISQAIGSPAPALSSCTSLPVICTMPLIAADGAHTMAVRSDGTVWSWGSNAFGVLGNGSTTASYFPVQVRGIDGGIAVSVGLSNSAVVDRDGTLWSWGHNNQGQNGDGTTMDSPTPVQSVAAGFTNAVAVVVGSFHSIALTSDGGVWGWGANSNGEVGVGSSGNVYTPATVMESSGNGRLGAVAIEAGGGVSLASKASGAALGWGKNECGQLGIGSTTDKSRATAISTLSGVVGIATGGSVNPCTSHSLAVLSDGTVWAWGDNTTGALGNGTTTGSTSPVQVFLPDGGPLTGIVAVGAGGTGVTTTAHSIALKNDGTVWAWGSNNSGQLGDRTLIDRLNPVQVSGISSVVAIATGFTHNVALKRDGLVWAWGGGTSGQLGDQGGTNRTAPVKVVNFSYLASGCDGVSTCTSGSCVPTVCSGNGTCLNGTCTCSTGIGTACQYTNAITCNGNGTAAFNGSCSCSAGFAGVGCQNCATGYVGYPTCVLADAGIADAGIPDAGIVDAGIADAGIADAGIADAGIADAGIVDAGIADAGVPDAGIADAGIADAGIADAGFVDAGVADAGTSDAGTVDGGTSDAGPADAGSDDAGSEDGGLVDGGVATDAGAIGQDAGSNPPDRKLVIDLGCGCQGTSPGGFGLLLGMLLFVRRVNRSRLSAAAASASRSTR
jgi:hypothetical protein